MSAGDRGNTGRASGSRKAAKRRASNAADEARGARAAGDAAAAAPVAVSGVQNESDKVIVDFGPDPAEAAAAAVPAVPVVPAVQDQTAPQWAAPAPAPALVPAAVATPVAAPVATNDPGHFAESFFDGPHAGDAHLDEHQLESAHPYGQFNEHDQAAAWAAVASFDDDVVHDGDMLEPDHDDGRHGRADLVDMLMRAPAGPSDSLELVQGAPGEIPRLSSHAGLIVMWLLLFASIATGLVVGVYAVFFYKPF